MQTEKQKNWETTFFEMEFLHNKKKVCMHVNCEKIRNPSVFVRGLNVQKNDHFPCLWLLNKHKFVCKRSISRYNVKQHQDNIYNLNWCIQRREWKLINFPHHFCASTAIISDFHNLMMYFIAFVGSFWLCLDCIVRFPSRKQRHNGKKFKKLYQIFSCFLLFDGALDRARHKASEKKTLFMIYGIRYQSSRDKTK